MADAARHRAVERRGEARPAAVELSPQARSSRSPASA
jgi:hypothetical protein